MSFNTTSRNADSSIKIIIRRKPENIPVPYELREGVSPEKWDFRIMQINSLCAKYSKPLFERIWFVFATLAIIIVPAVLNRVIFNAITPKALRDAFDRDNGDSNDDASNRFDGQSHDAIHKYIIETRLINIAIFIALHLVLWTPYVIWKRIGTMRARKMTNQWAVEDQSMAASFVPKWSIVTPGVFNINGSVTITTPPSVVPTLFNPNVYLPPYILAAGAQQQYAQSWTQSQPQSQIPYNPDAPQTAIPFNVPQRGAGGVAPTFVSFPPPPNGAPPAREENPFMSEDEKKGPYEFDDVKV